MPSPTPFARACRHLRKAQKLRQASLADKIAVGQTMISAIETGDKAGQEQTRQAIAEALGWPLEAMVELGRRLEKGEDPTRAERLALAACLQSPPPPVEAEDLHHLRGFRIQHEGRPTKRLLWVDAGELTGRDTSQVKALELSPGLLALVDEGDREFEESGWFILAAPPRLRRVRSQAGAYLLASLDGGTEAAAGPWENICLGRALWVKAKLKVAAPSRLW